MQTFTPGTQTLYAELVQRTLDAEFDERYDERGRFKQRVRKGRTYWHYLRSVEGKDREEYVGPADDPVITGRVERFAAIKDDFKARREMVRALSAAGLPTPDTMTARVAEALWKAGFFRLRGVLVGTAAYQTYAGLLGVKLPSPTLMTQDLDIAQFHSIAHEIEESMPPMLDVLRAVDPSFRPMPHLADVTRSTRYRTAGGYVVDILTPNRGSDDHTDRPAEMPTLGGASAQPLRHLDFLIHRPTRAALLYKGGIPVTVPMPWTFAIHKLIVAADRSGDVKANKDIRQAAALIEACDKTGRTFDLAESWNEAEARGPRWKEKLAKGTSMLPAPWDKALPDIIKAQS